MEKNGDNSNSNSKKYIYNVFFTKCEVVNGKVMNVNIITKDEYDTQNGGVQFPFDEGELNDTESEYSDGDETVTDNEEEITKDIRLMNEGSFRNREQQSFSPLSYREDEGKSELIYDGNTDNLYNNGWISMKQIGDNTFTHQTIKKEMTQESKSTDNQYQPLQLFKVEKLSPEEVDAAFKEKKRKKEKTLLSHLK